MLANLGRLAALMSVVALALIVGVPGPNAAFPGANGKIIYADSAGISVVNPDGTAKTLIRPGSYDTHGWGRPRWSPDGQRIAFAPLDVSGSRNELHVMNADGSGEVDTNIEGRDFAWSPDGSQFLLVRRVGGSFDIFRMNADGSGVINLTAGNQTDDWRPSWSPDGTRIVFQQGQGPSDIAIMNSDGSAYTNLTNTPGFEERGPDWSPDSQQIVFQKLENGIAGSSLWAMTRDGNDPHQIVTPGNPFPTWSPDGERIAIPGSTIRTDGSDPISLGYTGPGVDWQPVSGPKRSDYKNASAYCMAARKFLGDSEFSKRHRNHGKCVSSSH